MYKTEDGSVKANEEQLVMKFLMGDNSEAIEFLDEVNNLFEEENVTEDDIEKAFNKIDEYQKQTENVDKLANFSDEEKAKLKEIMSGRLDMMEMNIEQIAQDRFGKYQESDVDGAVGMPEYGMPENNMPNYRGLMGNRDEDGSLKPMPGKEPRR